MDFRLLRRLFRYLAPQWHLASMGGFFILLVTLSGAVSLVMLKPIIDGILLKSKAELIASDKAAESGEAWRWFKDFASTSFSEVRDAAFSEKPFKEVKTSIASRFNDYLRRGPVTDILMITVLLIAAGVLIKTMSEYARRLTFTLLNLRIMTRVRMDMYDKVMTFSMPFFNEFKTGNLMNRVVNEVNVVQDIIVGNAAGILTNSILILSYFGAILWIDWKLTLILMTCFAPLVFLLDKLARYLKGYQHKIQEVLGDIMSVTQEAFAGIRLVIASNAQSHESGRYEKAIRTFQRIVLKVSRFDLLASPVSELATTLIGLGIVVYALQSRVLNPDSSMTAGDFVVYVAFMFSLMKPIKDLNSLFVTLQRGMAVAGRVFEIMDRPTTIAEKPGATALTAFRESIEYRGVSFCYLPGTQVLGDVSFKVRRGEIVALVGPSGGGKSTLVDLLPRLYDPDSGSVLIDGCDIRDYKLSSIRDMMGIVTQETILFHDTVKGNIAYARPGASFEEIKHAAEVAQAAEFIEALPQGYDTVIGERGTRLSGGQRQRLCIARAVLRNPDILIFDEATSALDNESEARVQAAIDSLVKDRTSIVIAHRLSTIKRANRILVIDRGEIIEQGTHDELMRAGGTYKRLYELQFRET